MPRKFFLPLPWFSTRAGRAGFIFLAVAWNLAILEMTCKKTPFYLQTVIATLTVCFALWLGSERAKPKQGWRFAASTVGWTAHALVALFICLLALCIPLFVLQPAYSCYSDRARVSEMLTANVGELRHEIDERYARRQTLVGIGEGMRVLPKGGVAEGFVSANGVIAVFSEDPRVTLVVEPIETQGKLDWRCHGLPGRQLPIPCRPTNGPANGAAQTNDRNQ